MFCVATQGLFDVYLGRMFRLPSDKGNQLMQNYRERI